MVKCTKHPHRTEASAIKCYSKGVARRIKIRTGNSTSTNKVQMVKNRPPRLTKHGAVLMLVWEEDSLMRY